MDDIVERLREAHIYASGSSINHGCADCVLMSNLADEAAAEIERLRAIVDTVEADIADAARVTEAKLLDENDRLEDEIEQLRREISRFACDCDHRCGSAPSQLAGEGGCIKFRARRFALAAAGKEGGE